MGGERKLKSTKDAFENSGDSIERADERSRAVEPEIDGSTINKLLAEAESQSQEKLDEAPSEGDFEETWNFDATEELLAPEEIFSSDDLKGKS